MSLSKILKENFQRHKSHYKKVGKILVIISMAGVYVVLKVTGVITTVSDIGVAFVVGIIATL